MYRANLRSPVARQLKVLFNVLALSDLVDEVKRISDKIVLFGSCAEGTDVKDSDMDLFTLTSNAETFNREVRRCEQKIDRKLSLIVVNPNEFTKMKTRDTPLYERVSRDMTLWERE